MIYITAIYVDKYPRVTIECLYNCLYYFKVNMPLFMLLNVAIFIILFSLFSSVSREHIKDEFISRLSYHFCDDINCHDFAFFCIFQTNALRKFCIKMNK